jgi:hypothetical protein
MDIDEWKRLVDQHKNQPLPNAGSPELEAAKTTQAITNWWTQTGQTYWDKKIPDTLFLELRKTIEEHNKVTGSNVPLPLIPGTPADQSKMTAEEKLESAQQAYDWARQTRDMGLISETSKNLGAAYIEAGKAKEAKTISLDNSFSEFESTLRSYFSPGAWWNPFKSSAQKDDASAMESMRQTVGKAFYSGENEHAEEFANLLKNLPQSTRNEWNTNNTLNALSDSNEIGQLLTALRELIEATKDKGRIDLTVENY